jgi:hypothetical protein
MPIFRSNCQEQTPPDAPTGNERDSRPASRGAEDLVAGDDQRSDAAHGAGLCVAACADRADRRERQLQVAGETECVAQDVQSDGLPQFDRRLQR